MNIENKNTELENETITPDVENNLKDAIEETLSNLRMQSMLLGAQAICKTILDKIYAFESSHGKKSANDYKRCLKDIKNFCEVGLSRKVKTDGTAEPVEETVQN